MLSKMQELVFANPENEPLREAMKLACTDHREDISLIGDGSGVKITLNPQLLRFNPSPVPEGMRVFDYLLCDMTIGRLLRNADKSGISLIGFEDQGGTLLDALDHYTNCEYSKRFSEPQFALQVINASQMAGHLMLPGTNDSGMQQSNRLTGTLADLNKARVVRGAASGKPQNPSLLSLKLTLYPNHADVLSSEATDLERHQHRQLVSGVEKLTSLWHNITVTSQPFAMINNHPKSSASRS